MALEALQAVDPFIVSIVLLVGGIVGSRIVSERALGQLSSEQKVAVLDAFSVQRKYSLLLVLGMVAVFYRMPRALVAALAIYAVVGIVFALRKLAGLGLPGAYRRSFVVSQGIQLAGVSGYLAVLWLTAGI